MDEALVLARAQFGLNIGFHILFPSITIGLAWMLFFFRLRHERERDAERRAAWLRTYRLWVKIFADRVLPRGDVPRRDRAAVHRGLHVLRVPGVQRESERRIVVLKTRDGARFPTAV
jgi:hypothetical protein